MYNTYLTNLIPRVIYTMIWINIILHIKIHIFYHFNLYQSSKYNLHKEKCIEIPFQAEKCLLSLIRGANEKLIILSNLWDTGCPRKIVFFFHCNPSPCLRSNYSCSLEIWVYSDSYWLSISVQPISSPMQAREMSQNVELSFSRTPCSTTDSL